MSQYHHANVLPKDLSNIKSFHDFEEWLLSLNGDFTVGQHSNLSYDEFIKIFQTSYTQRPISQRIWKKYIGRFPVVRKLAGLFLSNKFNKPVIRGRLFDNEYKLFKRAKKSCVYGPGNDEMHIIEHLVDYRWLYDELADEKSKSLLLCLLIAQVIKDDAICPRWYYLNNNYPQYFDKDILGEHDNEVFVDCGAAWGDTYHSFKRCYSK